VLLVPSAEAREPAGEPWPEIAKDRSGGTGKRERKA
jgi:hypothetical protein